jgi:hypothetical protein
MPMTAATLPNPVPAIVCAPDAFLLRRVGHCSTCDAVQRFAGRDQAWCGVTWTCCGCGDMWTDGHRHERPFRRGWRKENIATAERLWAEAAAFNPNGHAAWLRDHVKGS